MGFRLYPVDKHFFYTKKRKDELLMSQRDRELKKEYNFIHPKKSLKKNNNPLYIYHIDGDLSYKTENQKDFSYRIDTGLTFWFLQLKKISENKKMDNKSPKKMYSINDLQFLEKEELEKIFFGKDEVFLIEIINGEQYMSKVEYGADVNTWIRNSI